MAIISNDPYTLPHSFITIPSGIILALKENSVIINKTENGTFIFSAIFNIYSSLESYNKKMMYINIYNVNEELTDKSVIGDMYDYAYQLVKKSFPNNVNI